MENNFKKLYVAPKIEVFSFVCEQGFSVSYIQGSTMGITPDHDLPEGCFDDGKDLTNQTWMSY